MNSLQIIEVRSEIGAGKRGASLGINAMKIASLQKDSNFFAEHPCHRVPDHNESIYKETDTPYARHAEKILENLTLVSEAVCVALNQNKFPLILAADHSSAYGSIAGVKAAYPNKRLGVIWIDAHADLNSPYSTPSGNIHGMPLSLAIGEDHKEYGGNTPSPKTVDFWNKMKNVGIEGAKVLPQDLIFVGVRSTEECEDLVMQKNNIANYKADVVNRKGIEWLVNDIFAKLADCDIIYVSFDVDSTDSRFSAGTGTPVKHGLSPDQALLLNTLLVKNPKVVCWEIAEVNPILDLQNQMAAFGFEVLSSVSEELLQR